MVEVTTLEAQVNTGRECVLFPSIQISDDSILLFDLTVDPQDDQPHSIAFAVDLTQDSDNDA